MGGFISGLKYLVTGKAPGQAGAQAAAAQQAAAASIAQTRQAQAQQDSAATTNTALAALGKTPRGQRLLLSDKDGGLANTLGSST